MNTEEIDVDEITRKLEAGEFDKEIDKYIKTPEFQFYSQPHFAQYELTDEGIIFTPNGSTFIPLEKFQV